MPRENLGDRRIAISDSQSLVRFGTLRDDATVLLVATPAVATIDLATWIARSRSVVEDRLHRHGAILFRGFDIDSVVALEATSRALVGDLSPYIDGRSPRTELAPRVYTSTSHPPDQTILPHNEMSYARRWPMRLHLCCIRPATSGGATPLHDARRVLGRVPEVTRARFLGEGVRYSRTYAPRLGSSWATAFRTNDRAEVEARCRRDGIVFEWRGTDELVTWQRRPAVATHPATNERVWFNQAHVFHSRTVPSVAKVEEGGSPRWEASYGDGARIPDETIDEIVSCYAKEEVAFSWQRGDCLVLDNMLVAHGRSPYVGDRLIALTLGAMCPDGGAA